MEILRRINYGNQSAARLQEFLKLLNERNVRYLLIGGYAVGYHGYPRAQENMMSGSPFTLKTRKDVAVLKDFGFDHPDLTPNYFCRRIRSSAWDTLL